MNNICPKCKTPWDDLEQRLLKNCVQAQAMAKECDACCSHFAELLKPPQLVNMMQFRDMKILPKAKIRISEV